jgi:putative ABC transport system permease protein
MLGHYFTLALRNFSKHKLFSSIKILGLTAGLTAALLIGLYLKHEFSYDACHRKSDRIVRAVMEYGMGGQAAGLTPSTGTKVAPTFRRVFPEVESAVRLIKYEMPVKYGDKLFEERRFYFADSTLFDVFTLPLLRGNAKTALTAPNQVVLTKRMAEKYFEEEDPIGKVIRVNNTRDYTVSGVMADPPSTSQIKPDFVASAASASWSKPENEHWFNANHTTYLLLRGPEDHKTLQPKIAAFMKTPEAGLPSMPDGSFLTYRLEPLRDIHLYSETTGSFEPNGDIRYVYILIGVGLLILLIGATTFINLTTATSTERAREVGVQKVLGALRGQLFWQHLGESISATALALLSAYGLSALLLPAFNRLFDRELFWSDLLQPSALAAALGLAGLISLLAGAYPALVVSKFQPAAVLKGQFKLSGSGAWLRKSLIVLQFAISVFLIICTLALKGQLDFIQNKKLGFKKEHVVVLPTDRTIVKKIESFKSEFRQNSHVRSISLAYETPASIQGGYNIASSLLDNDPKPVIALPTDHDFVPTMGIEMAAGENLSKNDLLQAYKLRSGEDTVTPRAILINEAQAKAFGWKPEEAVNRAVAFNGYQAVVRGVVRDFHFASFKESIGNLVIFPDDWGNVILVKLDGGRLPEALGFLEQKWKNLAPHRPFSYRFIDEEFDRMYDSERRTARVVTAFAGIAIFLACLGLFGLATYNIVQRTKEIGIRKVLGATISGIIGLLAKDFMKLVLVGIVAAIPAAWYVMNTWLQDFVYRIDLQAWMFVTAGLLAVVIAFLAVSLQSIRAALANPVKSLRSE